jgi:hypothetical protein
LEALRRSTLLTAVVLATNAWAFDFIDTRISFVLADDNFLAGAGETTPNSPNIGFGAGNQNTQFYDNFNTRFSGFESLSNLTLYKKSFSFFEGWTAEAALNVLLLEKTGGGIELRDNSSYVTLGWKPYGWKEGTGLTLTGFPVSADRMRLGYAYKISWGGSSIFTSRAQSDGVPGAKLQFTHERFYGWVGMKTGLLLNDLILEKERVYGLMGGAGVDIIPGRLKADVNGGYFQKGIVPGLANQGIKAPVNALGGSAQLQVYSGAPIGTSIDLRLYRNDPDLFQRFFNPESYPGGFSYQLAIEASWLSQTLEDPDVFAQTNVQSAQAIALQARFKVNYIRFGFLGLFRSLSFIQFDVPGLPPYKDFPDGTELRPEMFAAINADIHIPRLHLTPGFVFGLQFPAAFKTPNTVLGGNNPPPGLVGSRWVVVRDVNLLTTLPEGYEPLFILSAKITLRLDISEYFAFIGEAYYTRDPNRVTFRDDAAGVAQPTFEKEHGLGGNLILQARF